MIIKYGFRRSHQFYNRSLLGTGMSDSGQKITDADRRMVDGSELTSAIGVDEDEIAWRKEYTHFTDDDARELESVSHLFEDIAEELVDDFYDHLQTYNETLAILDSSSKPVEALKNDQQQYLMELGAGQYGQRYFDRRARIGKIHDMLDLGPKIYFGAYSIYYRGIIDRFAADIKSSFDPNDFETAIDTLAERTLAVQKLINLDQQVAMDTYIHSYNEQVKDAMAEQEALMQQVEADLQAPLEQVSEAAQGATESTNKVNESIQQQTESMNEVASEVSDMSATIQEIASTASEVSDTSDRAEQLAAEGSESADDAISQMESIEGAVSEVGDEMGELRSQMEEVSEFTELINEIADQTNLLALNANIEASRVGEEGQGFAVVADEIKGLAEESKENAAEIEQTITDVQSRTEETAESLADATEKVNQGITQVQETQNRLQKIVKSVQETAQGIDEVSRATDDQAASTEEVASMTDSVVRDLEEMADEIDEIAAANQQQAAQIQEISETVNRLTE